ncbi:MAG: polyhydroxyalkanoate synthesis regulator DNA-binding domain-containing protein [Thermodesulfobacteriota bacterium]
MGDRSSGQIVIKKYSNRRLYDTSNRKYITLEEISDLIKGGSEVKVIDTQSGEDISKLILIQVVLESEKNKEDILPVSFLHMLIKYGNKIARDFFENSFLMMFQPYLSFQDTVKKNIQMWQGSGLSPTGMNFPVSYESYFKGKEEMTDKQKKMIDKEDVVASSSSEIDLLRNKIKELDQKIESLNRNRRSRIGKKAVNAKTNI